jgi:hypothetical protein
MRSLAPAIAAALLIVYTPVHSQESARPDLASILRDAANYLEQYERQIPAVTAQEDYLQTLDDGTRIRGRRLLSEFLILADPSGWVEFRDVFEVDGAKVRDRDERLVRLFTGPNADAKVQGYRVVQESARFNLIPSRGKFERTLNVPLTALRYLRRENQARSQFRISGTDRKNDVTVVTVRFNEHDKPPVVGSPENTMAEGMFEVESGSGHVRRTEFAIKGHFAGARIDVTYAQQPALQLWLPSVMNESSWGPSVTISGRATYSNYKQFKVDTSTDVKK